MHTVSTNQYADLIRSVQARQALSTNRGGSNPTALIIINLEKCCFTLERPYSHAASKRAASRKRQPRAYGTRGGGERVLSSGSAILSGGAAAT